MGLTSESALSDDEVVVVSGERFEGALLKLLSDELVFLTGDEVEQRIPLDQLVRFGHPPARERRPVVTLTDGSQIVVAPLWVGRPPLMVDENQVTLRGNTVREFSFPIDQLYGLATPGLAPAAKQEADQSVEADRLWISTGDRLTGNFQAIDGAEVIFSVDDESLPVAIDRVSLLSLAGRTVESNDAKFDVWLVDGTKLCCRQIEIIRQSITATLAGGSVVRIKDIESIAAIIGYPDEIAYLSELEAADYKQTPYFNIEWPYSRDESLSKEMLAASGKRYAKGIAMHSAARLVYRLPPGADRFLADIAIDDSSTRDGTGQGGSVVFRVYLARDGELASAYESPIVRSGELPIAVDVDVAGSPLLVRVVDYADWGDESDHANWLDARLLFGED